MRPFQLHRPRDLASVLELLATHGENASVFAGGTELLIALKARVLAYDHLIDVKHLESLRGVTLESDGSITIGALCTHFQLARDEIILSQVPSYAALSNDIGNIRVRVAGTIGGNLCFAEPHADPPALLCALDAQLVLASASGQRQVAMHDFIESEFTTVRREGEVLTHVVIPPRTPGARFAYKSFGQLERPAVGVAVGCVPRKSGMEYRVWLGAITARPTRLHAVEEALSHASGVDLHRIARSSAEVAAQQLDVASDLHGAADYKRHLAGVFVESMLRKASELEETK
jgi:aerobic carbon-monoxide dehydrogenase medium subunit